VALIFEQPQGAHLMIGRTSLVRGLGGHLGGHVWLWLLLAALAAGCLRGNRGHGHEGDGNPGADAGLADGSIGHDDGSTTGGDGSATPRDGASSQADGPVVPQDAALPRDAAAQSDSQVQRDSGVQRDAASGQCETVDDLMSTTSCGSGRACDFTYDGSTNVLGCRAAGSTAAYAACSSCASCGASAKCLSLYVGMSERCLPFCDAQTLTGCPGDGQCSYSISAAGGEIGICIVPDSCDAISGTGCSSGLACYLVDAQGTAFCLTSGTGDQGDECSDPSDCVAGATCFSSGLCRRLCRSSSVCPSPATCTNYGFSSGLADVGYCS
jgi:hypothetical protein